MSASLDCVARVGLQKVTCSETRKIAQPFDQSELFSTFIQSNLVLNDEFASRNGLAEYTYDQETSLQLDLTSNDLTNDLYNDAENTLRDICSARASIKDFGDVPRHIKSLMVTMEQLQAQFKHPNRVQTVFQVPYFGFPYGTLNSIETQFSLSKIRPVSDFGKTAHYRYFKLLKSPTTL